jgi:hypothetical protein
MRLPLRTVKRGMTTAVSLWMAIWGCVMGCAQVVPDGSSRFIAAASSWDNSSKDSQPVPIADAENCHQAGGHSSLPAKNRAPVSNGALSCCPLEITVVQKWDATDFGIALSQDFIPSTHFSFAPERSVGPAEFDPSIPHSGRDTLLKTQLLRV